MYNLFEYMITFMLRDYMGDNDIPNLIAGGCSGDGITYKVHQLNKDTVTITVRDGGRTISTGEPADSNWMNIVDVLTNQLLSVRGKDVEGFVKKLKERKEQQLEEMRKSWKN